MAIGTPVQLGTASAASGSLTLALTTTADAPAGSLIVVAAARSSAANITGAVDSAGNSYVAGGSFSNGSGHQAWLWSFTGADLPSGGTITVSYNNTAGIKLAGAVSVSGASAVNLQGAGASGASTAPTIATGALGWPSEIVFGQVDITGGAGDTFAEAAGFTANTPTLSTDALRWAYQIVASSASVTYAPTLGTSRTWGANTLTFSGAVASPFNRAAQFTYLGM